MAQGNNNGFADALEQINTLLNVNQRVSLRALEKAANYFVTKLRPRIPKSKANKQHLKNSLKVVVKNDVVQVVFEDNAWYWHLVEHGHKKANGKGRVRGRHFVRNTMDAENEKISNIMLDEIINRMGG